ncbi:uncharacterized protein HKW66_Vig0173660 [Vigna angularis]|uniref:Transmembrane protein n=1 Tax=Phaseolus angularis TaxID=3914 RepID=A0A8T0JPG5_PHAAN|nr:uncharacterized protein HKW66_Vig0173660 [Vigna angularis]
MEILKLFVIALMPNLKVLLLTVLGSLLAMNRFNILSESAINNMNTILRRHAAHARGMNRNWKTRRIDEKEGVVDERDQMKGALAVVEVVKKDEQDHRGCLTCLGFGFHLLSVLILAVVA